MTVHDILHGRTCYDSQGDSPEVEAQIRNTDDAPMESVHVVFDEPTHEERYHQDERHPLENDPEGSEERDMGALLHQGEHNRNHQCRNEVRKEGEGSHGIQVPSQLCRHYGRSCSTRSDDAAQDSLPHNLRMNIIGICRKQDDANDDQHKEYLKQ